MAYYEYKRVRDLLPKDYLTTENYRLKCCGGRGCLNKNSPCEYYGSADYDGDMWTMTAYYIEELQSEISQLKNKIRELQKTIEIYDLQYE
jgi:hypothetical protein